MVSHTVMGSASTEIFTSWPAAAAVVSQTRKRLIRGLVVPVQIRVCDELRFQLRHYERLSSCDNCENIEVTEVELKVARYLRASRFVRTGFYKEYFPTRIFAQSRSYN